MNNFKSCVPCVCTGSGHKRVCEEHNSLIKVKPINEQMWYSKFNQTFENYRIKWNCIWKIKYTRII